jgi:hypothetical protein
MSRFTKSKVPILKRINSNHNKVIIPKIESISEPPIIEIPIIESHDIPIIEFHKVVPVEQPVTTECIEEQTKEVPSNVSMLINDIEKKELKRKRSRAVSNYSTANTIK